MEQKAKILLSRPKAWLNQSRAFKVFIDDMEKGMINNESAQTYEVDPGNHSLQCKVAWYSSQDLKLNLVAGETAYLRVRNGMKYYWHSFLILLFGISLNIMAVRQETEKPLWALLVEMALILPAVSYMLYYMTLGRRKYLVLEEDKENFFAS